MCFSFIDFKSVNDIEKKNQLKYIYSVFYLNAQNSGQLKLKLASLNQMFSSL